MKAGLDEKRCYEVEAGTPTLTIELESEQRMIPWHSFADGFLRKDSITLNFADWVVGIAGSGLLEIWNSIQLQDVRVIRQLESVGDGECHLQKVSVQKLGEEDN